MVEATIEMPNGEIITVNGETLEDVNQKIDQIIEEKGYDEDVTSLDDE